MTDNDGAHSRHVLLRTHGVRIGIRTNDPALVEQVLAYGIPGAELIKNGTPEHMYSVEARTAERGTNWLVRCGPRTVVETDCGRHALDCLLAEIQITVAEEARNEVFVHAGAVGWGGRAIILPGRSFSGKTSLVLQLLRQGASYYSDEYAIFDPRGSVHPCARPLHIRSGDGGSVRLCPAAVPGFRIGSEPLDVALVVFSQYRPDAPWRAGRLTPGAALLGLLANTVCARKRPRESVHVLRRVALDSVAVRGCHGDSNAAAQRVLQMMEQVTKRGY